MNGKDSTPDVILRLLQYTMRGDRFSHENSAPSPGFSNVPQLKFTLSIVYCDL